VPGLQQDIPQDFIRISQSIGADPQLIQGAGGNTSIKLANDVMWVKASGKWLQHAGQEDVFVAIDPGRVNSNIVSGEDDPVQGATLDTGPAGLRPSIETTLHSLMPHRVVFHTHSINTIVHAIHQDAKQILAIKLRGMKWGFVPYSKPGLPLARLVADLLATQACDILVIQNHGLVVGGDTTEDTLARMQEVELRLATEVAQARNASTDLMADACNGTEFVVAASPTFHQLALHENGFKITRAGSLYPDHVVFLGSGIAGVETIEEFADFVGKATDDPLHPKAIALKGAGVAHVKSLSAGGLEMLQALSEVARRIPDDFETHYLSIDEERELVNWDAEKYRQTL
jgi:rhamnose utilization protein RhaD (predicted bifunctional aldolase and dehydrogenase)